MADIVKKFFVIYTMIIFVNYSVLGYIYNHHEEFLKRSLKQIDVPRAISGMEPYYWYDRCRQALGPYLDSAEILVPDDCTKYICKKIPTGDIVLKTVYCPPVPAELRPKCSRTRSASAVLAFPDCCPIRQCVQEIKWNQLAQENTEHINSKTDGMLDGMPHPGLDTCLVCKSQSGDANTESEDSDQTDEHINTDMIKMEHIELQQKIIRELLEKANCEK